MSSIFDPIEDKDIENFELHLHVCPCIYCRPRLFPLLRYCRMQKSLLKKLARIISYDEYPELHEEICELMGALPRLFHFRSIVFGTGFGACLTLVIMHYRGFVWWNLFVCAEPRNLMRIPHVIFAVTPTTRTSTEFESSLKNSQTKANVPCVIIPTS